MQFADWTDRQPHTIPPAHPHPLLHTHTQACVRRRAELSLQVNESCRERAKEVIDKVFARCYSDTAPFDKIP
jgi:hypothetical protein